MSLIWVILGSLFQLTLAVFFFMMTAFSGGGIASGRNLSDLQSTILNLSLYFLPGLCIIAAAIVIYQYIQDGTSYSYWWYGMPIATAVIYWIFVSKI